MSTKRWLHEHDRPDCTQLFKPFLVNKKLTNHYFYKHKNANESRQNESEFVEMNRKNWKYNIPPRNTEMTCQS